VSALAIPAQLWAAYFGMNFEVNPILRSPYGLAFFWAAVAVSTVACHRWLARALRPDDEPDAPPPVEAPRRRWSAPPAVIPRDPAHPPPRRGPR
jgi:hypothetical protein